MVLLNLLICPCSDVLTVLPKVLGLLSGKILAH